MSVQTFSQWLDTFCSEKQIDLEEVFEIEGPSGINFMTYGNVVEAMKTTTSQERKAIKSMFVKLDFINADIKKYLRHLAQALVI